LSIGQVLPRGVVEPVDPDSPALTGIAAGGDSSADGDSDIGAGAFAWPAGVPGRRVDTSTDAPVVALLGLVCWETWPMLYALRARTRLGTTSANRSMIEMSVAPVFI
jgi:hypothetical protein